MRLRQPTKSRCEVRSAAILVGRSQGAVGQGLSVASVRESIGRIAFLSTKSTYTWPLPSAIANSGFPPIGTVPTTFPVAASIALTLLLSPLKENTRPDVGS